MKIIFSNHAIQRAKQRMCWNEQQAKAYWERHADYDKFWQGTGAYNIIAGGIVWSVAFDPEQDEVRVMSLCHPTRKWNDEGYLGPLTDRDGNRISYGPKIAATGPARWA